MQPLTQAFLSGDASYWHPAHFSVPQRRLPAHHQTAADSQLVDLIHRCMQPDAGVVPDPDRLTEYFSKSSLPGRFLRLFLVLYSPGHDRVVVSRSNTAGDWCFAKVFGRLLNHPRTLQLSRQDYQLQLDFMEVPSSPADFYNLSMEQRGAQHFEIGVDGFSLYSDEVKARHFLPGDAYVRSISSTRQLRDYCQHAFGNEYLSNSRLRRFRTSSFLIVGNSIIRLYRGLPVIGELTKEGIRQCVDLAIECLERKQGKSGKLLCFYDPVRDHYAESSDVTDSGRGLLEYSLRQHCGVALACLHYEKSTAKSAAIGDFKNAIEYFLDHAQFYELDGRMAASVSSEHNSRYGAAGLGLYLLTTYENLTGDSRFRQAADALAWHTLSQISESGEFIGEKYFRAEELSTRKGMDYTAFECPGEAICGLASYLPLLSKNEQNIYLAKLIKALETLLVTRTTEGALESAQASSVSWLARGILLLWDIEEIPHEHCANYVFTRARESIDKMYKVTDAPYPDYAGAFYERYGDYPHTDGARMELLMSAYEVARKTNNIQIMRELWQVLRLGAWSMMHAMNTKEAVYCVKHPDLVLGGIRRTITGHAFDMSTVHHVTSFYTRILLYWDEANENVETGHGAVRRKGSAT